jgi:hypothetical protein
MPIREWKESIDISIECSDRELPRAIAAMNGQYRPDINVHLTSSEYRQLEQTRVVNVYGEIPKSNSRRY